MYRILIADDERLEREAFKFIINKGLDFPVEIQEAVNGREAIVAARTFKPDIIFMDIKMPGINGIEAAKNIKDEFPNTEIIFLTAFNQFEYARDAIHIGASDFLIKPSSENDIIKVTERLIVKVDKLRHELNNKKNNELKLNRASGYLENEFIYAMAVRGLNQEKFLNYISILDLSFIAGRGGIMKIYFDTYPLRVETDYQKSILKKRCSLILKNSMAKSDIEILSNLELSNIYFFMNLSENASRFEEVLFTKKLRDIEAEIENELSLGVEIGAGTSFTSAGKTISSFIRASRALGNIHPGSGSSSENNENPSSRFPMYLEIEIEKAILRGERKEAERIFQEIASWYNLSNESFEHRKLNILELATVLKHSAACQDPKGTSQIDDSELKATDDSELLMTAFKIFLNNLLEQIAGIQETENLPAIEEACGFIENNFSMDIGLEDAAANCRLSSFYFSRLFKKQKGQTFIEYLTSRRIKEAKYLLSESRFSIKEVSRRTGYNDPNYFTRVFKRVENISPSEYRNKNLKNGQNNPDYKSL